MIQPTEPSTSGQKPLRPRRESDGRSTRQQTFTTDWFLREREGRELLGEWMKMTSVRSQDQKRNNVTVELAHLPDERVDSQNNEKKGIG